MSRRLHITPRERLKSPQIHLNWLNMRIHWEVIAHHLDGSGSCKPSGELHGHWPFVRPWPYLPQDCGACCLISMGFDVGSNLRWITQGVETWWRKIAAGKTIWCFIISPLTAGEVTVVRFVYSILEGLFFHL